MCLSRIDYDAKLPDHNEVWYGWKVFKLREWDGKLFHCFGKVIGRESEVVPVGEWLTAQTGYTAEIRHVRRVHGKRGMSYPEGFHVAKDTTYAHLLQGSQVTKTKKGYLKRCKQQLERIEKFRLYPWEDKIGWAGTPNRDPLQVTEQPPQYTFVVRRVAVRGVHTIGRQRWLKHEHRTWVAAEMKVLD